MSNPSKNKGTAAETAVVRWAREHGYPHADRQPLRGNRDAGDIALCPGVIVEVKNRRLATGVPTAGDLTEWMRQTELEREVARADVGILVVKRGGTTDPGRWFAYVTAWTIADIITGSSAGISDEPGTYEAPVCLAVADLVQLLRVAGWGAPLEDAA
jgi:hypothetical protein